MANDIKLCPLLRIAQWLPEAPARKEFYTCENDCAWYDSAYGRCAIMTMAIAMDSIKDIQEGKCNDKNNM